MYKVNDKVTVPLHLDDMCCEQHDPVGLADERMEAIVLTDSAFDEACDDVMVTVIDERLEINYLPVSFVQAVTE